MVRGQTHHLVAPFSKCSLQVNYLLSGILQERDHKVIEYSIKNYPRKQLWVHSVIFPLPITSSIYVILHII